jgi:hypothetical protein
VTPGSPRERIARALADAGVPAPLIDPDASVADLADECVLYPYLLMVAAERDAVDACPEDLVEQSRTVADFMHFAEVRTEQQASPAWAPTDRRR